MSLVTVLSERLVSSTSRLRAIVPGPVPVEAGAPAAPHAQVWLAELSPLANTLIGGAVSQTVTATVVIEILLRGPGVRDALVADLEEILAEIDYALLGWTPDRTTVEPLQFAGGRLVNVAPGVATWRHLYRTRWLLRMPA